MKKNLKYLPALILLVAVAFLIKVIVGNPQKTVNILMPLIGLGVVILVHEFGHFIVARMCKMKTEAFSLGFGHVVLGIKRTDKGYRVRILPDFFPKDNDPDGNGLLSFTFGKCNAGTTEYRISLIPLGGYVKIVGQEDLGSAEKNPDPAAFMNKPVWQRLAVISAGVICNVILAVIIFMVVFSAGLKDAPAVVGDVVAGSPAAKAGLEPGDRVVSIDGDSDIAFADIMMSAALGDVNDPNNPVEMKVEKRGGEIVDIKIMPQFIGSPLPGFGIEAPMSLEIAKYENHRLNDALYERTGLKAGDKIVAVNGEAVENSWTFREKLFEVDKDSVSITVQRSEPNSQSVKEITREIEFDYNLMHTTAGEPNSISQLMSFYTMVPRLRIPPKIDSDPNETKGGLVKVVEKITGVKFQPGDVIVEVAGVENPTYKELRDQTRAHLGKKMPLTVLRKSENGEYVKVEVSAKPKREKGTDRIILGVMIEFDLSDAVVAKTIDSYDMNALDIPDGSTITKVAGEQVKSFKDVFGAVYNNLGKEVEIEYTDQNGGKGAVRFTAKKQDFTPYASLNIPFKPLQVTFKADNGLEALQMGIDKTGKFILQTYLTLKAVIIGNVGADNLMGPIAMVTAGSKIAGDSNFIRLLWLQGLISACLAVMNFLPIPVVDGGHAVILIIEKIKGSPVNPKIIESISYVGFVLLMGLFVYVTWNDLVRVILGKF